MTHDNNSAADDRALRARWIVPIVRRPIENAVLRIRHGRIAGLQAADEYAGPPADDLGDVVLMPGLINAHAHLELSCYGGLPAPSGLWDWLDQLLDLRRQPGAARREHAAVMEGAAASLRGGVTTIADISRTGSSAEALAASPIRKICFFELISGAALPPSDIPGLRNALNAAAALTKPNRLALGISPHAPYTVNTDDLAESFSLAAHRKLPLTMHVLETADEAAWMSGRPSRLDRFLSDRRHSNAATAMRPAIWNLVAAAATSSAAPVLLAHMNHVDDNQLAELIHSRASVVWCPRAHRYFGHPPHRWREMIAGGVNLCIGTDGLPCNESLSMLDELRFLRKASRDFPAAELLKLATTRAAHALGLGDRLGRLSNGFFADFIAIQWDPAAAPDPVSNLLDGSGIIKKVRIDGSCVGEFDAGIPNPIRATPRQP